MPDDSSAPTRFERAVGSVASVAAPLSLITATLFYFGYASSRAEYSYFGIDVDTLGLSTQDFVMRSPQVLLAPLLILLVAGFLGLAMHAAVRRRVATALAGISAADDGEVARSVRFLRRTALLARGLTIAGYTAVAAGAVLLVSYAALRDWAAFALVTPLLLAVGAILAGYGHRLAGMVRAGDRSARLTVVAMWLVLTASVFWATATLAEASGRGLARATAQHLDRLPGVILDTRERLYLTSPGIEETALPPSPEQAFRYRYRHLRLLIQGHDRLFLVTDTWSASDSTLVVPMDASVRIQFRFVNDPP